MALTNVIVDVGWTFGVTNTLLCFQEAVLALNKYFHFSLVEKYFLFIKHFFFFVILEKTEQLA